MTGSVASSVLEQDGTAPNTLSRPVLSRPVPWKDFDLCPVIPQDKKNLSPWKR